MSKKRQLIDLATDRPTGRRAEFVGDIVSTASLFPRGGEHASRICCRRRPNRRPCSGTLALRRDAADDEISWTCPLCGDDGAIRSWQGSPWDRGPELRSGRLVSLLQVKAEREGNAPSLEPVCVYELLVELIGGPIEFTDVVARKLSIAGDRTLHELHELIQIAFDREQEEPYEFMFGAAYEPDARRFAGGMADAEDPPAETQLLPLDALELAEGQVFGYLFDFGEEWVHRISVLSMAKRSGSAVRPAVLERVGSSPPQYPEVDDLWDEDLLWTEFDDEYPLTGLYGPYVAEVAPEPEHWLAMEDLERLLLVMEAHTQGTDGHRPIESMPLHAVIHCVAESKLAEGGPATRSRFERRLRQGCTRHQAIHELGEQLAREYLSVGQQSAGGKKALKKGASKRTGHKKR